MGIFSRKRSSSSSSRSSDHRMPSLCGKVIMVTGGNSGLGKQSIMEFAKHEPAEIWLAARNTDRADQTAFELSRQFPNTEFKVLELDLASPRLRAETFLCSANRLDVLLLNARAGGGSSSPPAMTRDGYEGAFGVNHMGHALLTKLLMPVLLHTIRHNRNRGNVSDVHVVVVSSVMMHHAPRRGIQFDKLKTPPPRYSRFTFRCYAQSKLANTLFARRLAREYPQLTVAAVHPGVVRTNLMGVLARHEGSGGGGGGGVLARLGRPISRACMASVQDGIQNQLWVATSQDVVSGEYYSHMGVKGRMNKLARDDMLAEKLWQWTEVELENYIALNTRYSD
ncbi:short-chain dehydrogenase/reductase [Apiospora aurea]|uniref:Short-chain dehydrogenase/reductase n=1 Tax=Apiospora aurea TaxID=335848 RepID=A0ABR1QK86_9PEZI